MSESTHSKVLQQIREEGCKLNPHPLLQRQFIPVSNYDRDSKELNISSDNGTVIRLLQWNLLAQGLCQAQDSFILCPKAALDWKTRSYHILEELLMYVPDILCLQEVDQFSFLESHLKKVGYSGVFFPKPNSPCLNSSNNYGPDGCAIFWNVDKVKYMDHTNLVLEATPGNNTNQVAIVCKFETKSDGGQKKKFFVATTHLKAKVSYHKLRLLQGSFLEEYLCKHCNGVPLLLSGDFNAEPSEDIISVLKNSRMGFCSTYTLLSHNQSEPPYTTWKVRGTHRGREETCHTIDYLFFTSKYFRCRQLLHLPTYEEMGEGLLPSFTYPSDHLSLVADFQITSEQ